MKIYFVIIIAAIFFIGISCKKNRVSDRIIETESAEALSNKDIDSSAVSRTMDYYVITGTKTVFKYDHTWSHSDPAIMDGYSHLMYAFAVNLSSQTSFILIDNQIKQAPGFYSYYAVPAPVNSLLISKGTITGTKTSSTSWHVVMHFQFPNSTVDLTKDFVVK